MPVSRIRPNATTPRYLNALDPTNIACNRCEPTKTGRNLIVSFDGTANQFGENNTNVIELYNRIIKDETQLTYYNSGIGTYARPSWRSYTYVKQVLLHKIDLAIAWNFEAIILKGYRWLSEQYQPGDQIFLFGFSRGAYQVRALAGMIEKVGLILRGNEEQIPFAFELYADLKSMNRKSRKKGGAPFNMADRFKSTFSRQDVKVHFLGIWDTVSSVGLVRGKDLPFTEEHKHICYVRHALALDECRVKFLPEYIDGEKSTTTETSLQKGGFEESKSSCYMSLIIDLYKLLWADKKNDHDKDKVKSNSVDNLQDVDKGSEPEEASPGVAPRVKEVWFLGSHSDIGGGNVSNAELNNAAIPVLWMGNEALMAGLKLEPSKVDWDWDNLVNSKPTESLSLVWWFLELLPFKRLMYNPRQAITWCPHLGNGRIIQPGQKIHASVAFAKDYIPKARFADGMTEKTWLDIVGTAGKDNSDWVAAIGDLLEKDLFDHSAAKDIIRRLRSGHAQEDLSGRLKFIALSYEGAQAITTADDGLGTVIHLLQSHNHPKSRRDGCDILTSLRDHRFISMDVFEKSALVAGITHMLSVGDSKECIHASITLRSLIMSFHRRLMHVDYPLVTALSHMMMTPDLEMRKCGFETLVTLCENGDWVDVEGFQHSIINNFVKTEDIGAQVSGAWAIAALGKTEVWKAAVQTDVYSNLMDMIHDNGEAMKISGAYALSQLGDEEALAVILYGQTIDNLMLMLNSHEKDLKQVADYVLRAFIKYKEFRDVIPYRDIITTLVDSLKSSDKSEQLRVTDILRNFATYEEFRDVMPHRNIITPLVDSLKAGDKSEQLRVTDILRHFATYEEFRDVMPHRNIITPLVDSLKASDKSEQLRVTDILRHFATYEEFRDVMPYRDIITTFVDSLKASDESEQLSAIYTLSHFVTYEEFRGVMPHRNIITTLVDLLSHASYRQRKRIIDIFQKIAEYKEFLDVMAQEDIVKGYGSMLKATDWSVQRSALEMLSVLAKNKKFRDQLLQTDVMPIFVSKISTEEQSLAADLLVNFAQYEELRIGMPYNDVVKSLVSMLDTEAWDRAANMLCSLVNYKEFCNVMPHGDIVKILVRMLNTGDQGKRESAAGALHVFAKHEEFRNVMLHEESEDMIITIISMLNTRDLSKTQTAADMLYFFADYEEFRNVMLHRDTIKTLIGMLDSWNGRDAAVAALCDFAKYEEFRNVMPPGDIITHIVNMLNTQDERKMAADALCVFAEYEEFRNVMPPGDIITPLVNIMLDTDGNWDESGAAINVLRVFANYEEFRNVMLHGDTIKTLISMLDSWNGRDAAAAALCDFAKYEEFRNVMPPGDIITHIVNMLNTQDERKMAADALCVFAEYEEFRNVMPPGDIITPLVNIMLDTGGDWDERGAAANVLHVFTNYEKFRNVIPPEVTSKLSQAVASDNHDDEQGEQQSELGDSSW